MAHADWKRYYNVLLQDKDGNVGLASKDLWFKRHITATMLVDVLRARRTPHQPIAIISVRGNARNPQLQAWLLEHST